MRVACLCAATRRASRSLTRHYEEALRPCGLTPSQFELLGNLAGRGPSAQSDLIAAVAADQTTVSRTLKGMRSQGWISTESSRDDGRLAVYGITDAGRAKFEEAFPAWRRAQEQLERRLGDALPQVWAAIEALAATSDAVEAAQNFAG